MLDRLEPLQTQSLKDVFVSRFEALILSGELIIGQKLPSERDLAAQLGVSRPVVHEGIVELAARGLVTMKPRAGAVVNDFRREGSITLLTSLINYHEGKLDPRFLESILQLRIHMEVEFARLAALNRNDEHLVDLRTILGKERTAGSSRKDVIINLDFEFHLAVAIATGNLIYPLLVNSFRQVYTNFTGQFFSESSVVARVHGYHAGLVEAIERKDPSKAVSVMTEMLRHGEDRLRAHIRNIEISKGRKAQ